MTFPYEFDTTAVFRKVFSFALLLDVVLFAGILYSVFVSHEWVAVAQLAIIIAITVWLGRKIFGAVEGSVGVLTSDGVTVQRGHAVLGLKFGGPAGHFPMSAFSHVKLEQASGPIDVGVQGGPHARIYLIGREGTPNILIAREQGAGVYAAQEFADALGLELQDTRTPY